MLALIFALVIIGVGYIGYQIIGHRGPFYCATSDKTLKMKRSEAFKIARQSECSKKGWIIPLVGSCNENSGTWWLNMITKGHDGCSPACVVDITTQKAEINWGCTGLNPNN